MRDAVQPAIEPALGEFEKTQNDLVCLLEMDNASVKTEICVLSGPTQTNKQKGSSFWYLPSSSLHMSMSWDFNRVMS